MRVEPLVSVIMPAYNAENYLQESIDSVKHQTYRNWELIIIDNGSTDSSPQILEGNMVHPQISVLHEPAKGVGHARNKGLAAMRGEYFCFLDADDIMTKESISARVSKFNAMPQVDFVDGIVSYADTELNLTGQVYQPSFQGEPFDKLGRLDQSCLFGNTWMIKRDKNVDYHFSTDLTHCEDLFFYLTYSRNKHYTYVNTEILRYRRNSTSAMNDLMGLENGYFQLLRKMKNELQVKPSLYLRFKITKIMFLSWLRVGKKPFNAIRILTKYIR
ncbi:MAG: glycosyltransferase family 2 protein [Cyclobacteriaceae bacterium]